jgi:hypothetical protein
MKAVRIRQIYTNVHMGMYRGVDSLRSFLIDKEVSWDREDVFLFRNKDARILIAFAPSSGGYYYERLPKNNRWDFKARNRNMILTHFGKALGLKWNATANVYEPIVKNDATTDKLEVKNASVRNDARRIPYKNGNGKPAQVSTR